MLCIFNSVTVAKGCVCDIFQKQVKIKRTAACTQTGMKCLGVSFYILVVFWEVLVFFLLRDM